MPVEIKHEPPAKKAKRDCDKVKNKLDKLSPRELADLLAAMLARLDELEGHL